MAALFIVKFGSDAIKTVGGVAFWNFQPHIWSCVNKKKLKCHNFFNFWQIAKTLITFYSPMTYLIYHKVYFENRKH